MPGGRLSAATMFCAAVGLLGSGTVAFAQSINVDRVAFEHTEKLVVAYEFSARPGQKQLRVFGSETGAVIGFFHDAEHPEWTDDKLAGTFEVELFDFMPDLSRGQETFIPLAIEMREGAPGEGFGPVVAEKFVYIVNPVKPLPGSVTLPPGPFLPGQEIEIRVDKPQPEAPYLSGDWVVHVVRKGSRLANGATVLPAEGGSALVQAPGSGVHKLRLPEAPGMHELQVHDHNGFIVHRLPVEIVAPLPDVELTLEGGSPAPAHAGVTVVADGLAFPARASRHRVYSLGFTDRGTLRLLETLSYPERDFREGPSLARENASFYGRTDSPGQQRLIAAWAPVSHTPGMLRTGTFDYAVAGDTFQANVRGVVMLQDGLFFAGEPVGFVYRPFSQTAPAPDEVLLFKLADPDAPALQDFKQGAAPFASYPFDMAALAPTLPSTLPPGDYELILVSRSNDPARAMANARLTVIPPAAEFSVASPGTVVTARQPFDLTVGIPAPISVEDRRLELRIVHLGGVLDDCRVVMEHEAFYHRFGAGSTSTVAVPGVLAMPGSYEVRLYFGAFATEHGNVWPQAILLAAQRFTVEYRSLANTLSLENADPDDETEVVYNVRLPADFTGSRDIVVNLVRMPEQAASGVERLPLHGRYTTGFYLESNTPQRIGVLTPGAYELRLSTDGFCFLGDCRRILLDTLPFIVRDADWKGPPSLELLASDIAPEELAPSTFAELAPGEACGESDAETMEISFARLSDGKPVPFAGPVDFGFPFFVEGRLQAPARLPLYRVRLETPSGLVRYVDLRPTPEDPALLRSQLTYVMWDVGALGSGEVAE